MDESKAIKIIKQEMGWESKSSTLRAFEEAIKALEELKQYRAIGTVKECRAAVEKQTGIKPEEMLGIFNNTEYECKNCGSNVNYADEYCRWCGQKLDWSDEA